MEELSLEVKEDTPFHYSHYVHVSEEEEEEEPKKTRWTKPRSDSPARVPPRRYNLRQRVGTIKYE